MNITLPRITQFYLGYLHDHDASHLVKQIQMFYSQATIIRLAGSEHVDTRRAVAHILGFVGNYESNTALGNLLLDEDRSVALLAESSIKSVWPRCGSEQHRRNLCEIMRLISQLQYEEAVRKSNILLEENPLLAEARNQRAIALFALGEFQDAIEDSALVLDINPYHFGAAIGMGHAYLQVDNRELAIICFQHALQINPRLDTVRRHLDRITQHL